MAGLIQSVTTTVLQHYGWVRAEPTAPKPTEPSMLDKPLFYPYAQQGQLGLSQTKNPKGQLESYRSWVYSCIRAISFRVSMLPLSLHLIQAAKDGSSTESPILSHPYLDLMWKPNQFMSRMELWLTTLNHLDLTGNAYWLVLFDRLKIPREIWPLYPQYMKVVPDAVHFLKGYLYSVSQPPIKFVLDDPSYKVIHFKYPNPINPYYGMGPLEAIAYAYDLDLYMQVYQRNFFSEGARPDFVLETDQRVTKDDADLVWNMWDERHKGMLKSWRPGILGQGLKAKPLSVSNRDLAFASLADFSRDQMLAAFGVPAAKLGLVVDVNRANADAADVTFNREAVLPRIVLIEERIENDLLPYYPGQSPSAWLETDFENPVPTDRELELKERETYLRTGVIVVNEVREEIGKEPVEWGDKPLMPSGTVPLGEGSEPEPEPKPEPEPEPEPAPAQDALTPGPTRLALAAKTETPEEREQKRTVLWEAFVRKTDPEEATFVPKAQAVFRTQSKRVMSKVEDVAPKINAYFTGWSAKKVKSWLENPPEKAPNWIAQVLAVLDLDTKKWVTVLTDHLTNVVDAHGKQAVADIGVGTWDLYNPLITTWLSSHGAERIDDIQATTKKALRAQMIAWAEAGEPTADLVKRIQEIFAGCDRYRAKNIARTETGIAANYGLLQGWKQTGVVETKEWLSARDDRVRDSHRDADGQQAALDGNFTVGDGKGPAPGHIGLPEEDCGCRCTMLAGLAKTMAPQPTSGDAVVDPLARTLAALEKTVETLGIVAAAAVSRGPEPEAPKLLRTERRLMRDEAGRPLGAVETLVYEGGKP